MESKNEIEDISMHEVFMIFLSRWKYLLVLALLFFLGALIKHKYFPMYPAKGKMLIKNSQNAPIDLILKNETKPRSVSDKSTSKEAIVFLETDDFFSLLGIQIQNDSKRSDLDQKLLKSLKKLTKKAKTSWEVGNRVRRSLAFIEEDLGQIIIRSKSSNKNLSVYLVNEALELSKKMLIERDLKDLNEAEAYLISEKERIEKHLNDLEYQSNLQMKKKSVLSIDVEKGERSKYINSLKQQINEVQIDISENKLQINKIRKNSKKGNVSDNGLNKFGSLAKLKQYQDENENLSLRLKSLQRSLRSYGGKSQSLVPFQNEIQKIKSDYQFEHKSYEIIRESLSRIGLQKTYVKNKVEILNKEKIERVKSGPPLFTMSLLAIFLSQILGFSSIYLYELFRPESTSSGL